MTAGTAGDMLLDTSISMPPPVPAPETVSNEQDEAVATPPMPSTADAEAIASAYLAEDVGGDDVDMPSIQIPDEAALAAAAAAMAAAAQGLPDDTVQPQTTNVGIDGTGDLNSYLLAAAAASVHAQQQGNGDHKAHSEDSFGSTATPVPNSVQTNGTSVHGSEDDDARSTVLEQCRKFEGHASPYPLPIGQRTSSGSYGLLGDVKDPVLADELMSYLPFTEASVDLGKTRCYWALLSADLSQGKGPTGEKLNFVYLDPILQQHMAEQAGGMVGSNFYDYVHPEERDRVSDDMQKIVESRTLFGSVTRCRYSRIPRIREVLGAVSPPRDPDADRYVEDDNFVAIDIVINWIGDGMLLCFFHAIIDKAHEDNDEQHKSDWTNWCGTPVRTFTTRQCDRLWRQIKAVPREDVPKTGPEHVFQVIDAREGGRVLLSWPPPRFFSQEVGADLLTQSDTTAFQDGSYFADDFARLAQGVSIAPGSSSLSDANTSCTRRFRAKHTLTTEGKVRSIESVLIPYGGVILACFHTTFQQQLPPPDPKLVLQARSTSQSERRKAEDDASQDSPNKRPRREEDVDSNGVAAQSSAHAAETTSKNGTSLIATTHAKVDPSVSLPTPASKSLASNDASRPQPSTPATKSANGHTPKTPASKYSKPPTKTESSGLSALANPSLMYTNAPTKAPSTPANTARPPTERNTSTPVQNGTNGHSAHSASPAAGADSPNSSQNKACTGCGKINSPEWRRGPSGHKTLCNACGLRYARSLTRRKKKKGKDGEVEFIEPTGDPSIVPKSRGGGGGSLPGVHRKNSKKRKEEEAAKATSVSASPGAAPAPAAAPRAASSTASSSPASSTQSPATATPASVSASPAVNGSAKPAASTQAESAPTAPNANVKTDKVVAATSPAPASTVNAVATSNEDARSSTTESIDPAHSMAVSIALDAIAQATSSVPSLDAEALSAPVSNAISRAIAATIGSTEGAAGGLLTSQALPSAIDAVTTPAAEATAPASSADDLDPVVSAAALQTIESVVSEALYKQLVHSSLPAPKDDAAAETVAANIGAGDVETNVESTLDLSHALTADAIRAAAQAAIAQGVAAGEEADVSPSS